ncbi:MAG: hypothetical protein AAF985_27160, partial [Bacteroidota bacterium]
MKTSLCCKMLILFFFNFHLVQLSAQTNCDETWPPGYHHKLMEKLTSCCSTYIEIDEGELKEFFRGEIIKNYDP